MGKTLSILLLFTFALLAQPTQSLWDQLEHFQHQKRPQSALKIVEQLYKKAQVEHNQTALIKSILLREKFQSQLQEEESSLYVIEDLQKELNQTKAPITRSLLHSLLAQLYEHYLDTHWYEITEHTTSNPKEISTWNMATFIQKITQHYHDSLEKSSQQIPISNYQAILLEKPENQQLRPTLYDFLAYRALAFFQDPRYQLIEPNITSYIKEKEAFSGINYFIQYPFNNQSPQPLIYQALKIYQDLLQLHQKKHHKDALEYANLERLKFVYNHFKGEQRDTYYLDALNSLISQDPQSEALYYQAEYYFEKGDLTKALSYLNQAIKSKRPYLVSVAQYLKDRILSQKLSLTMERVNLPHENLLAKIGYKNIKKVFIKVLQLSPSAYQSLKQTYGSDQKNYIKQLQSYKEFTLNLPPTNDHKEHTTEVSLGSYPLGIYLFLISKDKNFDNLKNMQINFVSKMALIEQDNQLLILDRASGSPLKGVKANFYHPYYDPKIKQYTNSKITTEYSNDEGFIEKPKFKSAYFVELSNQSDFLSSGDPLYRSLEKPTEQKLSQKTLYLFTDRAIYRPEQRIEFKGLALKKYPNHAPKLLQNQHIKLSLLDPQGRRIESQNFSLNAFGTFSGSFLIPKKSLLGRYELKAEEGLIGRKFIHVQAYKRPKFEITFAPLKRSYRLGDRITIHGEAKSYTQSPIDQGKVRYHVYRKASFPWHLPWYPMPTSNDIEVASGQVKTKQDGSFSFQFKALPDPTIPKEEQPNFTYQISVEITDTTGETQIKTKELQLGFVALNVALNIPDEIKKSDPKSLLIESKNLDGTLEPLEGELTIEQVLPSKKLYRTRYWSMVDRPTYDKESFERLFKHYTYDEKKLRLKPIKRLHVNTKKSKKLLLGNLEEGQYLLTLTSEDRYGTKLKKSKMITIYSMQSSTPPYPTYLWTKLNKKSFKVGATATLNIKSSATDAMVYFMLYRNQEVIQSKWIPLHQLHKEQIPIQKEDQGDLHYQILLVQDNRPYIQKGTIPVPWNNHLNVELLSFRDHLKPNEKEQWRIRVTDPTEEKIEAEMVATIYDAALDQILPHQFDLPFIYPHYQFPYRASWRAHDFKAQHLYRYWSQAKAPLERHFYRLNWFDLIQDTQSYRIYEQAVPSPQPVTALASNNNPEAVPIDSMIEPEKSPNPIPIRKDLYETLLFAPHLRSNASGEIIVDFTTNGALTRWKFLGFIHNKELKMATIERSFVTQKELMISTNPPRFFRQGDQIVLQEKIVNMQNHEINGSCHMELLDPKDQHPIIPAKSQNFKIPPNASTTIAFNFRVPKDQNLSALIHRVTAKSGAYEDGEQKLIPILSNQTLITQSLPLWVNAQEQRTISLPSLTKQNQTTPYRTYLEFSSNPTWYALLALPYLMESPYASNDMLFSRYFANMIAQRIIKESTKVQLFLKAWQAEDQLKTPLEKKSQLKSILLQESPWMLTAQNQTQQMRQLSNILDTQKLKEGANKSFKSLIKNQNHDGGWSWFNGGKSNWFTTQYILQGFGELKQLGVDRRDDPNLKDALAYIDQKLLQSYQTLKESVDANITHWKADHLSPLVIHYLYTRSLYQDKIPPALLEPYRYYLSQIEEYWMEKEIHQQVLMALTMQETNHHDTAMKILTSLKERAIIDQEQGIHFKYIHTPDTLATPIETQSLMITLFEHLSNDTTFIHGLKRWLLKNKQTNHWSSTKSTTMAIYALLSNGKLFESSQAVTIEFTPPIKAIQHSLEEALKKSDQSAGYLYIPLKLWDHNLSAVVLKNPNPAPAWGAIYWQYLQPLNEIKTTPPNQPISIQKEIYLIKENARGKKLLKLNQTTLHVGDKVKVQLSIHLDRDMEYLMIKDEHASTFEPTNRLSQYKWQGDFGYYKSTQDSATYFFVDRLQKGTYIFEYPLFVTHQGSFSSGVATIESLYAPEFRAHSKGVNIHVK